MMIGGATEMEGFTSRDGVWEVDGVEEVGSSLMAEAVAMVDGLESFESVPLWVVVVGISSC